MKKYKFKKSVYMLSFIMGGALLAIGVYSNFSMNTIIGAALLILGFWQTKNYVIKYHEQYIEIRKSLIGATFYVHYNQITKIEERSSKRVYIHMKDNPQAKKIRLPLALLSDENAKELIAELKKLKGKKHAGTTLK